MRHSDYRCQACKAVRTHYVGHGEEFPELKPCYECHGIAKRIFSPAYPICHQGKTGNASNGYVSSPVSIKKT